MSSGGWCQLAMRECTYLGHVLGQGTVKPDIGKIRAVRDFSKTKKDIHAFLGLIGHYRRFIPNFADVAACLSDFTKNSSPNILIWTP